jgi:Uncharacterised nucleotidyltransferase
MILRRVHPFDVIARVLAARLRGCEPADELRTLVRSRRIEWERVVGLASAQFVLPALAAGLKDLALTATLDEELGAFLDAVHAANSERNGELRDELAAAVAVLNRAGIEPVLLKGAIRLADGLYPDDGWRMLQDLDLLLPKASLAAAIGAFEAAGYTACGSDGAIRRPGGACQIDLHTELFPTPKPGRLLPAEEILARARRIALGAGRARIPSVEHQLVHLIGHSQVRHFGHAFGRIALRDRLEAAALVHWGRETLDWQAVLARFAAAGCRRPLLSFLLALNDGAWCTVALPDGIDPLTGLQGCRVALQARSRMLAYIGSRAGWLISVFRSPIEARDGGRRSLIENLKRLIFEPGAVRRLARAVLMRRRHLLHALPYLSWLLIQ